MAINNTAGNLVEMDNLLSKKVVQNITQLKSIIARLESLQSEVESSEDDQDAILSISSDVTWEQMKTMVFELSEKVNAL